MDNIPVRHQVMLEEFFDATNVLGTVKKDAGLPLKNYNLMREAGYYGVTPAVDTFVVFGEFYREDYLLLMAI